MIYIYLYLTNAVVIMAETSHALTGKLTKLARFLVEKTKREVYKQDPLAELIVDKAPVDAYVPSRVKQRKASQCSYCHSKAHTRATCQKYRAMRWETSRLNNWLKRHQFRDRSADMDLGDTSDDPLAQLFK